MVEQPTAKYRKDYRAPDYTITNVHLEFILDETNTAVTAVSHVERLNDGADSLFLDGDNVTLVSVKVNGETWQDYQQVAEGLHLTNLPASFELEIKTHINPKQNTALEGLYLADGAFCTQCEAEGFRRITYYLDRPDVLATFTTKVIADKRYPFLLSNGNKIGSGQLENGQHWVEWQDPHAKPCYLFALVAGDFDLLSDTFTTASGKQVALEVYVDKGNLHRAQHAMTSLINSMKWDETRFGLEYDLDVYMIVAVDFFNMGAMENKGLNIFNAKFVLANEETATDTDYLGIESVIGHEYFHNWTGNRVTCRDWFQLSLKEGLTVFRDQEFSSDLGSRAVNRIQNVRIIRGPQFAEDASPMAHPIRPEKVIEMNNFYTLTVYEKGSEVIRMMHRLLGENNFQQGMKLYFARHDGKAATCDDFVAAMQDASGIDLTLFSRWYSQSGTPELSVTSSYDEQAQQLTLNVIQHTPATADQADKLPLHIPFDIALYAADGQPFALSHNGQTLDNLLQITKEQQQFVFDNIIEQPVISMLRDFSAPVKLHYGYQDHELTFLMRHADNDFARWDAAQMLLAKHIKANVVRVQEQQTIELPAALIDAFRGILLSEQLDLALIAEILTLPSETEIAGWFEQVDVDAIYAVREAIKQRFALELEDELSAMYFSLAQTDYQLDHQAIAERTLRNMCLNYLATTAKGEQLVAEHFAKSTNMTNTVAALSAANQAKLACRAEMMQAFSDKWQHDGLVMDKWFMLQATNPANHALDNIKAQFDHPAFSMTNPNRVRSLVGAFCQANPVHFHAKDGSGYLFLADMLTKLNSLNPQVASRLVDPLLKLKRFDAGRQQKMRTQLERLAALDGLSRDLFEKITKALAS